MILSLLLLVLGALAQNNLLPIRTGVSKLQVGTLNYAAYTINFKSALPDPVYNSVVSVSYVQSFSNTNGINVSSTCPSPTQTGMGCTIKSGNPNQYNVVYMSYMASDVGSLLVGTYQKTFTFVGKTSTTQTVTFKPNVDSNFINSGNSLFVNLYPFVASINSGDGIFSLNINSQNFDAVSLNISIGVTLSDVNIPSITVVFGFMLFDSSIITVSLYEGQSLIPGSVPQGYVYGIKAIKKPPPPARLLQIAPPSINMTASLVETLGKHLNASQMAILKQIISAFDQIDINTFNQTSPKVRPKPAPGNKSKDFQPPVPSRTIQLLRSGRSGISQLRFKCVQLNPISFAEVTQIDNAIDTNSQILERLKKYGLYQVNTTIQINTTNSSSVQVNKTGTTLQVNTTSSSTIQINATSTASFQSKKTTVGHRVNQHNHQIKPAAAPTPSPTATIDGPAGAVKVAPQPIPASAATSSTGGVDNNMFNNLFSTNGFVIMTASTDIDLIYFYEVDPVQNIPAPTKSSSAAAPALAAPPVLFRSTVTNQQSNPQCKNGETKVGKITQVDYIQTKMVVSCISCQPGQSIDPNTKNCTKTINPTPVSSPTPTLAPAPSAIASPTLSPPPPPPSPTTPTASSSQIRKLITVNG